MLTISDAAKLEKNKLASNKPWIILFELQLEGSVIRVCRNNEDVLWSGYTWTAFPVSIEPKEDSSKGTIPELELRISNVNRVMQGYVEQSNGAVGSPVILYIIREEQIGTTDPAELMEKFEIKAVVTDAQWVYITLGAPNPFMFQFPRPKYLKNFCRWKFKGPRCGYTGADTTCDHSLADCQSKGNQLRYGGFPGVTNRGVFR